MTEETIHRERQSTSSNMGKSGFANYKSSAKERVKADLMAKAQKGERVTAAAVQNELTRRWELLPESSRDIWCRQGH